jgi:hypothetical protein
MVDFTTREATDFTIMVVVTGWSYVSPVDLSDVSTVIECTFWDVTNNTAPALVKDNITSDDVITTTTNPLSDDATECVIKIPILDDDVDKLPAGTYRYEVSVEIDDKRQVVYPLTTEPATFTVTSSDTWETTEVWPDTR